MIPFLNLRAAYRELKTEIDEKIASILDGGQYILGPEVEAFEEEWAAYCEAGYAVGLGNGLDALSLALRALDIGVGHEVIVRPILILQPGLQSRALAQSQCQSNLTQSLTILTPQKLKQRLHLRPERYCLFIYTASLLILM